MKNPKRYRELSEPHVSNAAANAAIEAFAKDLEAIRETHKIANVHCILAGTMVENDEETEFMTSVHFGDSMRAQPMAAWSYGRETAEHDALMRQIVSESMKRAKKP